MSHLVFSIYWNPEEVVCKASEGLDLLSGREQAGKEQVPPSSMSLYRLPAGVVQIRYGLNVCLANSRSELKV